MVGRAVLTTEMSRTTRTWAVRARASTAQDRRGPSAGSDPAAGVWAAWCSGCIGPLTGTEPVVGAGSVWLTGTPRGGAVVAAPGGRAVLELVSSAAGALRCARSRRRRRWRARRWRHQALHPGGP